MQYSFISVCLEKKRGKTYLMTLIQIISLEEINSAPLKLRMLGLINIVKDAGVGNGVPLFCRAFLQQG